MENKVRNSESALTTENASLVRKYNHSIDWLIATNIFYLTVLEIICLVVFLKL